MVLYAASSEGMAAESLENLEKPDSQRTGNRSEYTAMKRFRIDADTLCIAVVAIAPILFFWKALFLKFDLFYDDIYYVFYNMRSLLYFMAVQADSFCGIPLNSAVWTAPATSRKVSSILSILYIISYPPALPSHTM